MIEQNLEKQINNIPDEKKSQEVQEKGEMAETIKLKDKLDKIESLLPDEQIDVLVEFALSEEKDATEKAIEIAVNLNNPNVLDGVRDRIVKEMDNLISNKKVEEI